MNIEKINKKKIKMFGKLDIDNEDIINYIYNLNKKISYIEKILKSNNIFELDIDPLVVNFDTDLNSSLPQEKRKFCRLR